MPAVQVEEGYHDPTGLSCGTLNKIVGQAVIGQMEAAVASKPELIPKIRPNYPIGTKRVVLETRAWLGCLLRDNVELVDGHAIQEITAKGLIAKDPETGELTEYEGDAILYGTGFWASKFLFPMKIKGVGGADLHETWAGDARAYCGISMPGFPNFMMTYGPNTNSWYPWARGRAIKD